MSAANMENTFIASLLNETNQKRYMAMRSRSVKRTNQLNIQSVMSHWAYLQTQVNDLKVETGTGGFISIKAH